MSENKEYIERGALSKFVRDVRRKLPKDSKDFFTRDEMLLNFQQYVDAQPAADVEPVVRCKDCEKTHAPFPSGNFYCTKFGCAVKPDFFCSGGEPKIDHSVQYRPCGR